MNDILKKNKTFFIPLILSLTFFLRKGIQYVIIGNPIPLLIITLFLVLLFMNFNNNKSRFLYISRIWAIVIIIWSVVRILFAIMNFATDVFDEYHTQTQFGVFGILLSISLLLMSIFIFKNSKNMY